MKPSNVYARGSKAFGFCDRCATRWNLSELRDQIYNQRPTGLMVCPDCYDIDHEQLRTYDLPGADATALRNPRPDQGLIDSRSAWSWNPVAELGATVTLGNIRITT